MQAAAAEERALAAEASAHAAAADFAGGLSSSRWDRCFASPAGHPCAGRCLPCLAALHQPQTPVLLRTSLLQSAWHAWPRSAMWRRCVAAALAIMHNGSRVGSSQGSKRSCAACAVWEAGLGPDCRPLPASRSACTIHAMPLRRAEGSARLAGLLQPPQPKPKLHPSPCTCCRRLQQKLSSCSTCPSTTCPRQAASRTELWEASRQMWLQRCHGAG